VKKTKPEDMTVDQLVDRFAEIGIAKYHASANLTDCTVTWMRSTRSYALAAEMRGSLCSDFMIMPMYKFA
jgi:hypothetical protein